MSGGNEAGTVTCDAKTCKVNSDDCSLCGNGKLDSGEECDTALEKDQWRYSTCSEYNADHTGPVTCYAQKNSTGTKECLLNISQCVAGPCDGIEADEECTSYQGGPQPCSVYLKNTDPTLVVQDAYIVCKPASENCARMIIDNTATEKACWTSTVAVDWCRLQSQSIADNVYVYDVTLGTGHLSNNFYGQINMSGATGTTGSGTGISNIKGEFVYWDDTGSNMKTIAATKTTLSESDGGKYNDQYIANVSTSDFSANGDYYYSWRFTADNGASWYYCRNENYGSGQNTGGAITSNQENLVKDEGNIISVTKPATTTTTEDFSNLTNRTNCTMNTQLGYTDSPASFMGNSSVSWNYKGFACAAPYTKDESSKGVGLGQKYNSENYIKASNFTGGIGLLSVRYKFYNDSHSAILEVYLDEATIPANSVSIKGSIQDATTGFGTALFEINSATAKSFTLKPKYGSGNNSFLISEVSWTSYP